MGVFRFPFNWGSETPTVPVIPPVVIPPSGTRWTALASTAINWTQGAGAGANPRFERVYARPMSSFGQSINFSYQIQSQFPFIIASDTQVLITSTITNP